MAEPTAYAITLRADSDKGVQKAHFGFPQLPLNPNPGGEGQGVYEFQNFEQV